MDLSLRIPTTMCRFERWKCSLLRPDHVHMFTSPAGLNTAVQVESIPRGVIAVMVVPSDSAARY